MVGAPEGPNRALQRPANPRSGPGTQLHRPCFATCLILEYSISEQSRGRIRSSAVQVRLGVSTQDAADRRQGLDARRYESDYSGRGLSRQRPQPSGA